MSKSILGQFFSQVKFRRSTLPSGQPFLMHLMSEAFSSKKSGQGLRQVTLGIKYWLAGHDATMQRVTFFGSKVLYLGHF